MVKTKEKFFCCILVVALLCMMARPLLVSAEGGWEYAGGGTAQAFWGQNATVTRVCESIAKTVTDMFYSGYTVTPAMVKLALGSTALGFLAAWSTGGTVKTEVYTMHILFQPVHYMYVWSFTSAGGDLYGPIRITPNPYYPSRVQMGQKTEKFVEQN